MITHPRTEELAESVRLWIDEIRPTLDPRNAFLARVAANAMATIRGSPTAKRPFAAASCTASPTLVNSKEPNVTKISMMPIDSPQSPTRFTTNAFLAASPALLLRK